MSHSPLVVIGNANVDLSTYVDQVPEKGETVIGTGFSIGMGGKGANQAVAAARAGADVAFIGRIGDDVFGDMVLDTLTSEGLNLESLARVPGSSGVASIYVESGGANRIVVFPGASGTLDGPQARTAVASHSEIKILVSQLEINTEAVTAALEAARAQGALTILNTAPAMALSAEILQNTTWLVANEVEIATVLAGAGVTISTAPELSEVLENIGHWAVSLGCNVLVTLGDQGAVGYESGSEVFHYRANPVVAEDTVGAGDCCVGYFAAFLAQGMPWQQALAGGVIAASDSVTRPGAQSSYPGRQQSLSIHARAQASYPA
jgi:ribokinase